MRRTNNVVCMYCSTPKAVSAGGGGIASGGAEGKPVSGGGSAWNTASTWEEQGKGCDVVLFVVADVDRVDVCNVFAV